MATNSILNDLFAQILHSEEKVRERFAKLKQVNDEIERFQARTSDLQDEIKSFQGNIVIKRQKIADQELQLKCLTEKQKILTEQKEFLETKRTELRQTLEKVQQDSENEREEFLEESEEFLSLYDLINDGRKNREIVRMKKLEGLRAQKSELKKEIENVKKAKNEIDILESKKAKLLFEINQLEDKQRDIDNLITTRKGETQRLQREKISVAQKHQNDPEIRRVSAELQASKNNNLSLEGVCDAMAQELKELQQEYYQTQLQKQRRQRQRQQQQQQQQQQRQKQQQQGQKQQQQQDQLQRQLQLDVQHHTMGNRIKWQNQQQGQHHPPNSKQVDHEKSDTRPGQWTQENRIQRPLFSTRKFPT